jgi:hypothetical protein
MIRADFGKATEKGQGNWPDFSARRCDHVIYTGSLFVNASSRSNFKLKYKELRQNANAEKNKNTIIKIIGTCSHSME